MSCFAHITKDGIVDNVIVADQAFVDSLQNPKEWVETFEDSSNRKNYAGIGYSYDKDRDAFIPPCVFPSWALNEETGRHEPPVKAPSDEKFYIWDEGKQEHVKRSDIRAAEEITPQ